MKTVIIEDEKAAVRNLTSLLYEVKPEAEIDAVLDSIGSTIEWFGSHPMPDLVFMDIHLADGSAFEIFEHISITCPIIFTTAYDEYALRAFKVNSIDYLLKPVHKERLESAIQKFERFSGMGKGELNKLLGIEQLLHSFAERQEKQYRTRFLISGAKRFYTIQVGDIAYFYSLDKVTFAVTKDGKAHVVDLPLSKLEEQLDGRVFFRVNRLAFDSKRPCV